MSQATTWNAPLGGPGTMSAFAGRVVPSFDAVLTQHSGSGRPSYAAAGTAWLKIVSGTQWELYVFTGSADILQGTYNPIAGTFVVNSGALGFPTASVARTDVTPLALVNGRVVPTQGANGEGIIRLRGRTTSPYDEAGLIWANGNTDAAFASLLAQASSNAIRLLDGAGVEALRFGTAGDIWSKTWGALSDQIVPPGATVYFPFTSAPAGYVKKNGALLSRTTYSRLWAAVQANGKLVNEAAWSSGAYGAFSTGDLSTNFRIPDENGWFTRGVRDEGGYTIGTYRADKNKSHNHGGATANGGVDHTHNQFFGDQGANFGVNFSAAVNSGSTPTGGASAYIHTHAINSDGSSEGEPRNIPQLACIKY